MKKYPYLYPTGFLSWGAGPLAAALILLCASAGAAAEIITGVAVGIRDGDTFVLLDESKVQHVIRPAGCNTPERGQPFYQKAKESLSEMIYGKQLVIDWYKLDKWGRKVGNARVGGLDVCLEQIRRGLAVHFKKYQHEQSPQDREAYSAADRSSGCWGRAVEGSRA